MDRLTKEHRSRNMSRIRSKHTKPERQVRSILHSLGFRFRLHTSLPGTPDIVLPKYRTAIFVHGCFWHRHKNCRMAYKPKTKTEFWETKFKRNIQRHQEVVALLLELRWRIIVVWECQVKAGELPTLLAQQLRARGRHDEYIEDLFISNGNWGNALII